MTRSHRFFPQLPKPLRPFGLAIALMAIMPSIVGASPEAGRGGDAGRGPALFRAALSYPIPPVPLDVAAGDLNGDGATDAVVSDQDSRVDVLLQRLDGTFAPYVSYSVTDESYRVTSLALADLNADSALDIAAHGGPWNVGPAQVWILINQGDGTFVLTNTYDQMETSGGISASDVDGDGSPDLVFGTADAAGDPHIGVMLNRGDGSFGTAALYPAGDMSILWEIALGDFDGDAATDVAVAGHRVIAVLLNQGDGTLGPPVETSVGPGALVIGAADLNDDGLSDVGLGDERSIRILLGAGDGSFIIGVPVPAAETVTDVALADMDGDAVPDLVASTYSMDLVVLGRGDGTFRSPSTRAPGVSDQLAIGDVTGDGRPDVVGAANSGALNVLVNAGEGRLIAAPLFSAHAEEFATFTLIVAADLNADSAMDLLVGSGEVGLTPHGGSLDRLSVLMSDPTAGFRFAGSYQLAHAPGGVAVGDVNGDQNVDVVAATQANDVDNVSVLLGNGDGTFQQPQHMSVPNFPARVSLADVTGDGPLDVVLGVYHSGMQTVEIKVLPGRGDGTFGTPITTSLLDGFVSGMALSDLDGDGSLDAVLLAEGESVGAIDLLVVATGNGGGRFSLGEQYSAGAPGGFALADLDGDGRSDLAATGESRPGIQVLLGNGDGTFLLKARYPTLFVEWDSITAGDYDGDGDLDLAVSEHADSVTVMVAMGDGTFRRQADYFAGVFHGGQSLVTADFTGDGRADVAALAGEGAAIMAQR